MTPNGPLLLPVWFGAMGVLRVGEGEPRFASGRTSCTTRHSRNLKANADHQRSAKIIKLQHEAAGTLTMHSRHQTPPSWSVFAALSSFFPHPARPSSFLRPRASLPPQTRHVACQREPWGPGTTPRSIGDTFL